MVVRRLYSTTPSAENRAALWFISVTVTLLVTDDNVLHLVYIAYSICCLAPQVINFQFSARQLLSVRYKKLCRLH